MSKGSRTEGKKEKTEDGGDEGGYNEEKLDGVKPLPVEFPKAYNKARGRRSSVSAEADKEETKYVKKVIPKSDEALERIKKALATSFLFQGIDAEQKVEILDAMAEIKVKSGDQVITQGNDGDFFYVVEAGKYEVHKRDSSGVEKKVFAYDGSGSFGELALMYNAPRAASVKAATDGILWAVDRATFRHIIIDSQAKKRQLYESFLDKVPLFAHLARGERSQIADCLETLDFKDGEHIITQGEKGEHFYIIVKGSCRATITPEGKTEAVEVNRMQVGAFFGERALILNQLRAANVIASGDVRVAGMDRSTFERLLGECKPEMQKTISEYRRPN
jgi:cAMP-dependent protein kinase regulator